MPYITSTPKPPYYAVIFTSINADVDHTEHVAMYGRLVERARTYDGYLGIEPARNADGTGLAAVYFRDVESINAWARDPEHQVAKRKGRELWYSHYMIRICRVEREYGRPDSWPPRMRRTEETDMRGLSRWLAGVLWCIAFVLTSAPGLAADYPAPKEGSWVVRDVRFQSGEVLPELRLHYTTVGAPTGEPVLILHGTTGSAASMLTPTFAGELFGPGQPLDASRYYVILPDAIGTGKSSKPSDGLRVKFPKYNYDDMVTAQHRLVTEHLGVRHLRLVLGNSMGGMQTWMWAQKYPDVMDVAVPMASLPTEMSGRNWLLRRLIIDSIRNDPEWMNGNYTTPPRSLQFASVFFGLATSGGTQRLQKTAPTREKADQLLQQRLSAPFRGDANDHLYQWESSRDYNASPGLERIGAVLLAINSADDERNPPELGLLEREIKRVKQGRVLLIPGSEETFGHGTTGQAKFWKQHLAELLQSAPRRGK